MKKLLIIALAVPVTAWANTPEDVYGVSARTIAMGGAGTALPGDHAATHYNPAGLAFCRGDLVALDASAIVHNLGFVDNRAGAQPLVAKSNRDQGRFGLGACLGLPFDLALGMSVEVGYPGSISVDQQTANQQPAYVLYGANQEQISLGLGLAWRAARWLSIGVGLSILVHSELPLQATIPVTLPDPDHPGQNEPVSFSIALGVGGALASRVGVLLLPTDHIRLGVAYREALYHNLQLDTSLEVETVLVNVPIPLHLDSLSWFSPQQLSFGASGEPIEPLTLTADVTWYHWGTLADNTYPFINVFSTAKPGSPAEALVFPTVDKPGWQDVVAVRAGAELRLLEDRIVLRGGLGWRGAAVANQDQSNVNLLDGPTLTFTGGVGAYVGRRAPVPGQPPEPHARRKVGSFDIPDFSGSFEAFVRVDSMGTQTVRHARSGASDPVPEKDYDFGGSVLQIGMTAAVTW